MAPAAVADAGYPFLSGIEVYNDNDRKLSVTNELGLGAITPPQTDTPQPSSLPRIPESLLRAASTVQSYSKEESTISDQYVPVGILRRSSAQFPEAELYNLQKHEWIQTRWNTYESYPDWSFVQVYVLPHDVARIAVSRTSNTLRKALRVVMANIDRSPAAWKGDFDTNSTEQSKRAEDESLWYIFNTLDNPNPMIDDVRDADGKLAMQELIASSRESRPEVRETSSVIGLKTPLHPYQCRSAATMIQREVHPRQMLDPRLEVYKTPLGQEYYYDKEEGTLLRSKRIYEEACGGILAETMGCGKTLICLAVILSTRGHFPRIPTEYQETKNPTRKSVGSLMQMAAATAGRFSVPWPSHFRRLREMGINYARCEEECERHRGEYTIPPPPSRYTSRGGWMSRPPAARLRLISGTLIIVPPNLVDHWTSEIASHTEGLHVLVLRSRNDKTPSEEELLKYDIVLFARTRFEREAGEPETSRHVPSAFSVPAAESPLKKFHWLRIIVDEGHNVAGHGYKSSTMHMLDQLHVERRWVVSGTPSNGLYGAELSLASHQRLAGDTSSEDDVPSSVLHSRKKIGTDEELKDLDNLRLIVVEFLKHKPWANSRNDDPANWTKYIKPNGEDGKRRKAPSLRAVLQGLVVRHRLDVINEELPLPRLHNKVVSLEPTFYDKMSINLFLFNLTVNAITSERKDQDYMFQSRNRKHLSLLINHLRQAGFWWTGHKSKDIESTIEVAEKYLTNHMEKMAADDIQLLKEGLKIAHRALASESFSSFCHSDELGVYVQRFPDHAREYWSLTSSSDEAKPLLLGLSQARLAQTFITSHLMADDPAEGLAGAGISARRELMQRSEKKPARNESNVADNLTHKNKPTENRSPKKTFLKGISKKLSSDSPLSRTKIVATTSAKLTYLLDRVQELHTEEKIIIFYENNNTAFWIAEGLELLGIDFRIYANTLKTSQKAAYLSLFGESSSVRILLMDLRQASHGLHIASASRVFIVNPIWRPYVESQAIKRAHRIGQTRPVYVETLVLKDTLEEKMLLRRQEMSNSEMQHAEKDMLDDSTMSSIIQRERFYELPEHDDLIEPAYLQEVCGFFDRHELPIPDDYVEQSTQKPTTPTKKRKVPLLLQGYLPSPQFEVDLSPDLITPAKKKKVSTFQIVTEKGIVMTPPRRGSSSRASRSPPSASDYRSPAASPGGVDESSLPIHGSSLFGGGTF